MIIMLLVCVEWNKSPLLYIYKLEQLYKHLPGCGLHTLYMLHTKMAGSRWPGITIHTN